MVCPSQICDVAGNIDPKFGLAQVKFKVTESVTGWLAHAPVPLTVNVKVSVLQLLLFDW